MKTSTPIDRDELRQRATLTVDEAAQILGISRVSAYQGVKSGDIPSIRIGRRCLVPTARLLALIDADA